MIAFATFTLAFMFFPLFILGLYSIFYGDKKNWYYFTIGLIGICFSHNLSLLMCLMVTILVFFLNIKEVFKDKERFKKLMNGGILAILICLSFIGPMVEMMVSDKFSYGTLLGSDMVVKRAANPLYAIIAIPSGASPWQPMGIGLVFIFLLVYLRKVMIKDKKDNKFSRDMVYGFCTRTNFKFVNRFNVIIESINNFHGFFIHLTSTQLNYIIQL